MNSLNIPETYSSNLILLQSKIEILWHVNTSLLLITMKLWNIMINNVMKIYTLLILLLMLLLFFNTEKPDKFQFITGTCNPMIMGINHILNLI